MKLYRSLVAFTFTGVALAAAIPFSSISVWAGNYLNQPAQPNNGFNGKPFDFNALTDLMQSNSVTSIDQLVPLLPDNYKKTFTLMLQSGSLQSASQNAPRVISYGNYGVIESIYPGQNLDRLFLGFQSDARTDSKLPNNLEVIEYVPETQSYQFYQVDFSSSGPSVTKNPDSCKQCHGMPLRPNWTAYPRWDGSLGNHNGLTGSYDPLAEYATHDEAAAKFKILQDTNSRLKPLDFSQYFAIQLENPSANLSDKIGSQLQMRDVSVIQNSKDYSKFKYAIAGAFLGCINSQDFFDPSVFSELQSGVYNSLSSSPPTPVSAGISSPQDLSMEKLVALTGALVERSSHFGDYSDQVLMTSWLRLIYEGQGRPEVLKDILGTPPATASNPAFSYDFVGFGIRMGGLRDQYIKLLDSDSSFKLDYSATPGNDSIFRVAIAEENYVLQQYGVSDAPRTANGPATSACQQLAVKSKAATLGYIPINQSTVGCNKSLPD